MPQYCLLTTERMLTIMSVEYYCFEIFYYIVYSCEPQYCLLTTDVC